VYNLLKNQLKSFFFYKGVASSIIFSNLVTMISLVMIHKDIDIKFLPTLLIVLPILALANQVSQVFSEDYISGRLEFVLVTHEVEVIVSTKVLGCFIVAYFSVILNNLCAYLFFNVDKWLIFNVLIASIPVVIIVSSIVVLIGSMQLYFDRNSNILTGVIFPFLIPSFILYGLYFDSLNPVYLYLLLGLGLIYISINSYLSNSLLRDLYNR